MPCKKSELVNAINSFSSARVSGDATLINFAASLINSYVDTLEFAPETEEEEASEE